MRSRRTVTEMPYHLEKTELLGLEAIQDIIELVLWTLFVMGERIVSLLIVSDSENGKTELMKKYRKNRGVHVRRRFTAYGILTDLRNGIIPLLFEHPRILGAILNFEFTNLLNYKQNTANSNIEFLDAVTEEGLSKESAYWTSGEELGPFENLKAILVSAMNSFGLLTSTGKVKANLYKGGWLSRNIVVSFSNSALLDLEISNSIARGEYRRDKKFRRLIKLNFPDKQVEVFLPEHYSQQIRDLALEIAENYSEDLKPHKIKGFRLHKSLISLVKASALRDGRKTVNDEDVERIEYLSQWFNLKMKNLKKEYPYA